MNLHPSVIKNKVSFIFMRLFGSVAQSVRASS